MELLDGLNLNELVKRFGPTPTERAVHLLAQARESLSDAHHQHMVHRDIKPANLFVCRLGTQVEQLAELLFDCQVPAVWDRDRARTWWNLHLPLTSRGGPAKTDDPTVERI